MLGTSLTWDESGEGTCCGTVRLIKSFKLNFNANTSLIKIELNFGNGILKKQLGKVRIYQKWATM